MPGKRVRFSRTNTIHALPTPPLSLSSLSPVSPPIPLTPLTPYSGHLPYGALYSQYSKPNYSRQLRLHSALNHATSPFVNFDMRDHPATITMHHQLLPTRVFSDLATDPPLQNLSLTSPHLLWSIPVCASHGPYVTVLDVLESIYYTLRMNITHSEFASLPSDKDRRRATRAYEHRYRRLRSSREYDAEKRQGLKRVDFLMDMTRFMGLSITSSGSGVLLLSFA